MILESFSERLKNKVLGRSAEKAKRWPHGKSHEEVYDDHIDQIHHHLKELHKLTHHTSLLHKAIQRGGADSSGVHEMHDHVNQMLKKHFD